MANDIMIKKTRIKGDKGNKGNTASSDTTVPLLSIVFYDEETIPDGYELYREDN